MGRPSTVAMGAAGLATGRGAAESGTPQVEGLGVAV
jgi:hypothetical protein